MPDAKPLKGELRPRRLGRAPGLRAGAGWRPSSRLVAAICVAALAAGAPGEGAAQATRKAAAKPSVPPVSARWGALADLPGRYWVKSASAAVAYVSYEWESPGRVMSYMGMDAGGNIVSGKFELDPATQQISGVVLHRGQALTTAIQLLPDGYIEEGEVKGERTRETVRRINSNSFHGVTEVERKGAWRPKGSATYSRVPKEFVDALGWTPNGTPRRGVLAGIGQALKEGAAEGFREGFREGVRDGVRERTTRTIAGKPPPIEVVTDAKE